MKGWKTWAGALLVGASGVMKYMGHDALAEAILMVGAAVGLIGIGHKLEKTGGSQ